jgi:hypothetical protein
MDCGLLSVDAVDRFISDKVLKLITVVQHETNGGEVRANALKELWSLSYNDNNKIILCLPELGLLKLLRTVLLSQMWQEGGLYEDRPSIRYCIYCLWYLSREVKNRLAMVAEELEFVSILLSYLASDDTEWKEPIMKTLSNCVLSSETHCLLLLSSATACTNDEHRLFKFCFQSLPQDNLSSNSTYHRFFANIATVLRNENITPFIEFPIVSCILHQLYSFGPFPKYWSYRVNGVPYWCLNFLMSLSSVPAGAKILHAMILEERNLFHFWKKLLKCEQLEGLKAAIMMMNLTSSSSFSSLSCKPEEKEENEGKGEYCAKPRESDGNDIGPLFVHFPHLLDLFLDVFYVHLGYDISKTEVTNLANKG